MRPRLFLAEDDLSIRQMLAFFLTHSCDCEVVGQASDGQKTLQLCENLKPTAIVSDLRLPGMGGVGLLKEIRRRHLPMAVIFYTGAMHETCLIDAIEAQPEGFVLKSDELSSLRQAVQAVCSGAWFWAPGAAELREKKSSLVRRFAMLSDSERAVLTLIGLNKSTKEIAAALHKSEHTVSHQRQSIMNKLRVHNALALASLARDGGLAE